MVFSIKIKRLWLLVEEIRLWEALFLTNFASEVMLVHRRDELRAEKILQKKLLNHPKISTIWIQKLKK